MIRSSGIISPAHVSGIPEAIARYQARGSDTHPDAPQNCAFRAAYIAKLPRVTFFGIFAVLELVLAMVGFSFLISQVTDLPFPVAILATAPGGISEMAVTAQVLHLAVPTVVAFQVVRGILVNGFATHYFAMLTRLGMFRALRRILRG